MSDMIALRLDTRAWERLATKFAAMPPKIARVRKEAAIEGGDKVRTDVRRGLKVVSGVKTYASITARVFARSPAPGRYCIIVHGPGLPLSAFPTRSAGGAVSADVWGVDHLFKRSFFSPSGRGRARLTRERLPVRALFGPNLAKEMLKGGMVDLFEASVRRNVGPVIEKRLARALALR
ncbi:hypothetical protein EYW49_20625 [Siculibacillus lacustris]|uniref:Uncharacterized protein n=1 Tax=Siculibacillus lacustris TaxID=1549641 RepID=A0A4V2KSL6_9HYPH|nr:hypothetical protein [Siculibacillus lacustris]TBW33367.1 hypothetical protein EYW49_20625 [Siculibacillus lacustris]